MCLCIHVRARVGAHACALAGASSRSVYVRARICMYDYYSILVYMRSQSVRMNVGPQSSILINALKGTRP